MALNQSSIVKYTEIIFPSPEIKLGRGAYGMVLQAKFRNNKVAVKLLHTKYEKTFIETEAAMLIKYRHKNIVTFYGAFYDIHEKGVILELMEGGSLGNLLHKYTCVRYTFCHVTHWSLQILNALEYLHTNKVIHRDLKPLNMLMSNDFLTVKLSDFGTVREIDNSMTSCQGTLIYMAPEVSTRKYDHRCDIYSFGTVLFELLTREGPIQNKNGLINKIQNYSQEIQTLIKSCWSDLDDNKRPTIEIIRSEIKTIRCDYCSKSCAALVDTITNKKALAGKLINQNNNIVYCLPPKLVTHVAKPKPTAYIKPVNRQPKANAQNSALKSLEDNKLLLKKGEKLLVNNKNNWEVLHHACYDGNFETVKSLLKSTDRIDVVDQSGYTPLAYAIGNGHFEIVELLLKKGANINNKSIQLLLTFACKMGRWKFAEWLLDKNVGANAADKTGSTPLHYACFNGNFNIIESLLKNGADITIEDNDGKVPWDLAVERGFKTRLLYFQEQLEPLDITFFTYIIYALLICFFIYVMIYFCIYFICFLICFFIFVMVHSWQE